MVLLGARWAMLCRRDNPSLVVVIVGDPLIALESNTDCWGNFKAVVDVIRVRSFPGFGLVLRAASWAAPELETMRGGGEAVDHALRVHHPQIAVCVELRPLR